MRKIGWNAANALRRAADAGRAYFASSVNIHIFPLRDWPTRVGRAALPAKLLHRLQMLGAVIA